jgi:hypothetical protein
MRNLLRDTLGQQMEEGGRNWTSRIKQELERLGVGDIWESRRHDDKKFNERLGGGICGSIYR